MALFKRKARHAQVTISLASRSSDECFYSSPDHFLSNDIIRGSAVVQLPPGADFSRANITLKGTIRTTTEDTATGALAKGWRTEHLPFLGVAWTGTKVKRKDDTIHVPFYFDLSKCERLAAYTHDLPPSLDSRSEGHKASDCQYEITYYLTATAHSSRSTLASTTHKIFVLPVTPDAFSAQHSEAPNEYHWAESVTKHPRVRRENSSGSSASTGSHGPRIEIAGQEPDSIVFNSDDAVPQGETEVPFVVKMSNVDASGEASLPSTCLVKAHLITKTHITPDGLKQIGTPLEFLRTGGNHVTKVQSNFEQEAVITIPTWETCASPTTEPFSIAKFSLPYHFRHEKSPLPSFFTPLLSRRYFLDLTLVFPERANELFKLTLPVEVAYDTLDAGSDDEHKKSRESSPGVEARL